MGPPGIGKTAIVEQAAAECGTGMLSYAMTHHTRQSAIGLPELATHQYEGKKYTVTEYTMSEIVASVYVYMEQTGYREGILFLDEINCVSETLAPVMLQLLQFKKFGTHKVPEGWIIVAAGNPPELNHAVDVYKRQGGYRQPSVPDYRRDEHAGRYRHCRISHFRKCRSQWYLSLIHI